jgi:branched-chain amino acid transport system ATP-binding protein
MLIVNDVHTYYDKSYILQGVSLDVKKGEIVTLLGRNGAGKTTLLKTIMGYVKPRSGKIYFGQKDITNLKPHEISKMGIGYVPQDKHLFRDMTVLENLKVGMKNRSDLSQLKEVFDLFPILEERKNQISKTLSGGQQQMLIIARALVTNPELLLVDEISTGLMPIVIAEIGKVLKRLNNKGISILLVEEKVPFAFSLAKRAYILEKGQIKFSGETEKLKRNQKILTKYLGVTV